MREYSEYTFKDNQLYYFDTYTGYHLEKHEQYPDMYYIWYYDKKSKDFFNLALAKDNAKKLDLYRYNITEGGCAEPVQQFK